jgi:hypothetical protein
MTSNENLVRSSAIIFDLPFVLNLPDGRYEVNSEDYFTKVEAGITWLCEDCKKSIGNKGIKQKGNYCPLTGQYQHEAVCILSYI